MNTMLTDPATDESSPAIKGWRVANLSAGEAKMDLSHQWFARPADQRFLSLDDLIKAKKDEFFGSTQELIYSRDLEPFAPEPESRDDFNKLMFLLPGGQEVASTHWGFQQACGLVGAPAKHYREDLPSQIVAQALGWGFRYNRATDQVKVYFRSDGTNVLRALNGPDYGRIPDYEIAEVVQQAAGNRWKVPGVMDWSSMVYNPHAPVTLESTTLFASDRDMFIFLVDDLHPIKIGTVVNPRTGQTEDDLVFRGFYIEHSEVGKSSLKVCVFYLRAICCNRIMWGVEGFEEISIRHSKNAPDRWLYEAQPALESFAAGSTTRLLEGVERAKAAKVAEDDKEAMAFLKASGLSMARAKRAMNLVETEEGHPARSRWDFAQGITAAARTELNNDTRIDLELTAKRILDKVA